MFTKIEHNPYATSDKLVYTPKGARASDGVKLCNQCDIGGRCILHIGEPVRVESLWFRSSSTGDPMILAYVQGQLTGEYTHIPVGEMTFYLH